MPSRISVPEINITMRPRRYLALHQCRSAALGEAWGDATRVVVADASADNSS